MHLSWVFHVFILMSRPMIMFIISATMLCWTFFSAIEFAARKKWAIYDKLDPMENIEKRRNRGWRGLMYEEKRVTFFDFPCKAAALVNHFRSCFTHHRCSKMWWKLLFGFFQSLSNIWSDFGEVILSVLFLAVHQAFQIIFQAFQILTRHMFLLQ